MQCQVGGIAENGRTRINHLRFFVRRSFQTENVMMFLYASVQGGAALPPKEVRPERYTATDFEQDLTVINGNVTFLVQLTSADGTPVSFRVERAEHNQAQSYDTTGEVLQVILDT
jgi:hypothetical protein